MWAYERIFYQIYPLGFCAAPEYNDNVLVNRIQKVVDWIPHIQRLGANAIYFCPVFSSDRHGYDTRDYRILDCRLGSNADFASVCAELHRADIKIVLDGVFNHVGRGFWAFQDVLHEREHSAYRDWFVNVDFNGNNGYNDALSYEGWEGHLELVKLNLRNEAVIAHIFDCIDGWIKEFDIDGLRLDVAYSLDLDFVRRLRSFCERQKPDFYLLGEVLHGDYNRLMNDEMLHSVTNYQVYKGMWSSFNDLNMFEINYTLERHFTQIYRGKHPLNFVDNHDVARIASTLNNLAHLRLIYVLMFAIPGIPCIYYGSEWGIEGIKEPGNDRALRPSFSAPIENDLTAYIAQLIRIHKEEPVLSYGSFRKVLLTNRQYIFEREWHGERILTALNADNVPYEAYLNVNAEHVVDLLTGAHLDLSGSCILPSYSVAYWKVEE